MESYYLAQKRPSGKINLVKMMIFQKQLEKPTCHQQWQCSPDNSRLFRAF